MAEQQSTQKLLREQIGSIDDQIRMQRKKQDKDSEERERLGEYITQLELGNKRLEKDLKRAVTSKEDLLVEDNIIKLEIKRVRQALNERADKVYSLEQRKMQLKQTMKDRLDEIKLHKDLLLKQQRDVDSDKAAINKGQSCCVVLCVCVCVRARVALRVVLCCAVLCCVVWTNPLLPPSPLLLAALPLSLLQS